MATWLISLLQHRKTPSLFTCSSFLGVISVHVNSDLLHYLSGADIKMLKASKGHRTVGPDVTICLLCSLLPFFTPSPEISPTCCPHTFLLVPIVLTPVTTDDQWFRLLSQCTAPRSVTTHDSILVPFLYLRLVQVFPLDIHIIQNALGKDWGLVLLEACDICIYFILNIFHQP